MTITLATPALVVLLTLVTALAYRAGYGKGSADTFEKLRPERIAKDMQVDAFQIMRDMQSVHDAALDKIVERQAKEAAIARPVRDDGNDEEAEHPVIEVTPLPQAPGPPNPYRRRTNPHGGGRPG